jgi:hypothetical protein
MANVYFSQYIQTMENPSAAVKIGVASLVVVLAAGGWYVMKKDSAPEAVHYEIMTTESDVPETVVSSGTVAIAPGAITAYLNRIEGKVDKETSTGSVVPSLGDSVRVGETVSTGDGSSAEIIFADSSVVRLAANSKLTVSKSDAGSTELDLDSGEIWARVLKPLTEDSFFSIKTSDLSAGVRGTSVRVARKKGKTDVDVIDSTGK